MWHLVLRSIWEIGLDASWWDQNKVYFGDRWVIWHLGGVVACMEFSAWVGKACLHEVLLVRNVFYEM